ncbi:MAG: AAA family ATPase [Chloroflexi bacterium]|nr:AAA family ATPase [Chloroflexota bacterium]
MEANALVTKFHRPAPLPQSVQRRRLTQLLDEGLAAGRPLTLVSAPAGFGKTTCIAAWIDQLARPVAWLSLDRADDDPRRFFYYLAGALRRMDTTLGQVDVEGILHAPQAPPADAITGLLLQDLLRLSRPFVLVLDDFHVIQDALTLGVLERLLAYHPPHLHLVLITREDPQLPLARLRANNQMTEIRAGDLRFTSAEAQHFLNQQMGLSLSPAQLRLLEERTEGWIAGLQLVGLSVRGRADAAGFINSLGSSHRYILSYLTEEVLSRQDPDVQEFLLQTSVLDKLCPELCDAVTGRAHSAALLDRLFNANLFLVPLDDDQRWYRYHHLFADLLRSQQSRLEKDAPAQLHRRASHWYAGVGMAEEAIEHALAAGDYPRVIQLLERFAPSLALYGNALMMERWVQAIPIQWHSHDPKANLALAWTYLLRGNFNRVGVYLDQANAAMDAAPRRDDMPALRAEWDALQSNRLHLQGQAGESIALATRALQAVPPDDFYLRGVAYLGLGGGRRQAGDFAGSLEAYQQAIHYCRASGNLVAELLAVTSLSLMALQHGQLHFAAQTAQQGIEYVQARGFSSLPMLGVAHTSLGMVYLEWNRIDQAGEQFLRGAQLGAFTGHNATLVASKTGLAQVYLAQGDLSTAVREIQEATDLLPLGVPVWLQPEVIGAQVHLYLAQDNSIAAEAALKACPCPADGGITTLQEPYCLAQLRLALYRAQSSGQVEDFSAMVDQAGRLIDAALDRQHTGIALQGLLLRACMALAQGHTPAARQDLSQAVALAAPQGYLRAFLDQGAQLTGLLAALLRSAPADATQAGFIQQLRAALPPGESSPPASGSPAVPALPEALTERQLAVLRLVAQGLKYDEIAGQLFISKNTVRFYIKEIYGKLAVNSRARAVEVARRLGLL